MSDTTPVPVTTETTPVVTTNTVSNVIKTITTTVATETAPVVGAAAQAVVTSMKAAIVRTVAPLIVAFAASVLLKAGIKVPNDYIANGIATAVGAVYYAGVHYLEVKVSPLWGRLLIKVGAPAYPVKTKV